MGSVECTLAFHYSLLCSLQGSSKRKDDGLMVRGGMRIPDKVDDDEEDSGSDSDDDEEDDDDVSIFI